jgi:hypothetical protein
VAGFRPVTLRRGCWRESYCALPFPEQSLGFTSGAPPADRIPGAARGHYHQFKKPGGVGVRRNSKRGNSKAFIDLPTRSAYDIAVP